MTSSRGEIWQVESDDLDADIGLLRNGRLFVESASTALLRLVPFDPALPTLARDEDGARRYVMGARHDPRRIALALGLASERSAAA